MHGRIFQVSNKPISRDEWLDPDYLYSEGVTDYVVEDYDRADSLKWLADSLPVGAFSFDGQSFVLLDEQILIGNWEERIKHAYHELMADFNIFTQYSLKSAVYDPIHNFKFHIKDYAEYTAPSIDFYNWVLTLNPGDKIYIGGTYDYHF